MNVQRKLNGDTAQLHFSNLLSPKALSGHQQLPVPPPPSLGKHSSWTASAGQVHLGLSTLPVSFHALPASHCPTSALRHLLHVSHRAVLRSCTQVPAQAEGYCPSQGPHKGQTTSRCQLAVEQRQIERISLGFSQTQRRVRKVRQTWSNCVSCWAAHLNPSRTNSSSMH